MRSTRNRLVAASRCENGSNRVEISPEHVGLAVFVGFGVALAFVKRYVVSGRELYERLAEKDEIIALVTEDRERMRTAYIREVNSHRRANDGLQLGTALMEESP